MSSARSIGIISILNVFGGILAVANTTVTSWFFGTSRQLEVYFAAAQLETLLLSLAQSGPLAEIFLPIYIDLKTKRDQEYARKAFSVVINWLLLGLAILGVVLWLAALPAIKVFVPGFEHSDHILGMWMFRAILPLMFLQVLSAMFSMMANAEHMFGKPESVSIFSRVLIIVAIVSLAPVIGIWAMVAGLWAANLSNFIGIIAIMRRSGYRHHFIIKLDGFDVRDVFKKLLSTFAYVLTTQFYTIVINAMVSYLPQGTYAVFKYVNTLVGKMRPIVSRPIAIVFFSQFATAWAEGTKTLTKLASTALSRAFATATMVNVAILVAGGDMLDVIWGSEKFGQAELQLAETLMTVLFFGLFLTNYGLIQRRIAVAIGNAQTYYLSLCVVQIISAILSWVLIRNYEFTGLLIVLFTGMTLTAVAATLIVAWRQRSLLRLYPFYAVWRWVLSAAGGVGAGWLLRGQLAGLPLFDGQLGSLWMTLVLVGAAWIVTLTVAWLTGEHDVRTAQRKLFRALNVRFNN